jgi:hypothetical protein
VIISEQERNRILRLHRGDFILKESNESVRNKLKSNLKKIVDIILKYIEKDIVRELNKEAKGEEGELIKTFISEDNLIELTLNTWKPYLTKIVENRLNCISNNDLKTQYMLDFIKDARRIVDDKIKNMGWIRKKLLKGMFTMSGMDIEDINFGDTYIGEDGITYLNDGLEKTIKKISSTIIRVVMGQEGGRISRAAEEITGKLNRGCSELEAKKWGQRKGEMESVDRTKIIGKVDKNKISNFLMANVREVGNNVIEILKT